MQNGRVAALAFLRHYPQLMQVDIRCCSRLVPEKSLDFDQIGPILDQLAGVVVPVRVNVEKVRVVQLLPL